MIILAISISAQSAVDSLLVVLGKEKNLQNIPVLQNQISDAYKISNPEKMQEFATQALKILKNKKIFIKKLSPMKIWEFRF